MKRILIIIGLAAPAMALVFFTLQPKADRTANLPLAHFYIVTFTTFSAAVVSILLGLALGRQAKPRHVLAAAAFAIMGSIFFSHGIATRGALINHFHPAIAWSAWLTLFGGGALFTIAGLDGPGSPPHWRPVRLIVYAATAGVLAYFAVAAFASQWLTELETRFDSPSVRDTIFVASLGLWLVAAFRLWQIWRVTRNRVDGVLGFVAFWLATATVSMHRYPVWNLSWWMYHVILLVGFLVTILVLAAEYEQVRQFRLVRYYLALSLILTALLALIASALFSQFSHNILIGEIQDPAKLSQAIINTRLTGLVTAAVTMGLLFAALLSVVGRADSIITTRTKELSTAYANLRRAEAMRDDLTNMIIHDLRSPLTAIAASIEILPRFLNPESRSRVINSAQAANRRMTGLIDDLLTVSKIEAGELTLQRQNTPVEPLLADRLEAFASQAAKEEKTLTLACPPDLSANIDSPLISRVLDNLLGNALKYTKRNGKIQILAGDDNNGRVTISVRDDGEGIPDEYKARIFDKFMQAPNANEAPIRKGTGLGLTFCRLVVESHGGQIQVADAPGGGSEFSFWLPKEC